MARPSSASCRCPHAPRPGSRCSGPGPRPLPRRNQGRPCRRGCSRQVARPPGTVRVGGLDAAGPQDGGDGVAEVALADGSRRLDGQQRHDLQQVALDHVAQRARAVVVACTALQGQILIEDDFHLGDVVAAPDRLQEVVGEPQAEDVQDGGLAQKMVHPVDVILRNKADRSVRLSSRADSSLGAEGLLHDQTGTGGDLFRPQTGFRRPSGSPAAARRSRPQPAPRGRPGGRRAGRQR